MNIPPHIAELLRTYRLLKLGVSIPESRLSRYEEDMLMVIDDEIEKMKADNTNTDRKQNYPATSTIRNQGIGEYCDGESYEECLKVFGDKALWQVCATCPD